MSKGMIRRPVGLIKGAAGSGNRPIHILQTRIGDVAHDFFSCGVNIRIGFSGSGFAQLTVYE